MHASSPSSSPPFPPLSPLTTNSRPSKTSCLPDPYRWLVLAVFCVTTASNAMLWTTFAPISDSSSTYFFPDSSGVESLKINMIALMFQITYLPGTVIASHLARDGGLAAPILFGAVLTAVGSVIRSVAVFVTSSTTAYYLVLLGQSLSSLAQPCFINSPGLLAANWFGPAERDFATTVASLFAIVGNAAGQVMPPLMVECKTGEGEVCDKAIGGDREGEVVTGIEVSEDALQCIVHLHWPLYWPFP